MTANLSLLLDGLIVVLLAVTIGYAFVLNRKLATLRTSRAELERLFGGLHGACEKAERNLLTLRDTAETVGRPLQGRVDEAKSTRDDIARLLERAESTADRLERGLDLGRKAPRRDAPAVSAGAAPRLSVAAAKPEPTVEAAPRRASPAHAALIKALQGVR